jgi:hypothetical protein
LKFFEINLYVNITKIVKCNSLAKLHKDDNNNNNNTVNDFFNHFAIFFENLDASQIAKNTFNVTSPKLRILMKKVPR